MTKQEMLDAINSTIVANGQKGITAESLNNILNEMVNATPEGGSGGGSSETGGGDSLKFYASDFLTPDVFNREFLESMMGTEDEPLAIFLLEMLDNNATVYAKILKGISDAGSGMETGDIHSFSIPAITIEKTFDILTQGAVAYTPATVAIVSGRVVIMPTNWGEFQFYTTVGSSSIIPGYTLNEDGSYSYYDHMLICVPASADVVIPESILENNAVNALYLVAGAYNGNVKVAVLTQDAVDDLQNTELPQFMLKSQLTLAGVVHNITSIGLWGLIFINGTGVYKSTINSSAGGFNVPTLIQSFE